MKKGLPLLFLFIAYVCIFWNAEIINYARAAWCTYGTDCTGAGGKISGTDWNNARLAGAFKEVCKTIENLSSADTSKQFHTPSQAATVTKVMCHCRGTCTTPATIAFADRAGNAMNLASTLTCDTGTGDSTFISVSSGGGLNAGEGMNFSVSNTPSPTTDEYEICAVLSIN